MSINTEDYPIKEMRRAIISGKVKKFVEYLESTGTQIIHTNNTNRDFTKIIYKINGYGYNNIQGQSYTGGNGKFQIGFKENSIYVQMYGSTIPLYNEIQTIEHDSVLKTHEISISNPYYTGYESQLYYLFGLKDDSGSIQYSKFKCFNVLCLYNDSIIRNLYPAISNEPSHIDEPCMYDLVSGQCFYNQGTGTFLVGDDIDIKVFPEGYVFGSYNLKFKNLPKLSINFTPLKVKYFVEYLQGDNNSYINTNFKFSSDIELELKFNIPASNESDRKLFGIVRNYKYAWDAKISGYAVSYENAFTQVATTTNDTKIHLLKMKNKVNVDEVDYGNNIVRGDDIDDPILLFANYENGTPTRPCVANIYHAFLSKSNNILKLYPAISAEPGHVNEPCMYDSVSDTCFYNQGTGTFLVGPKIDNPIGD